MLTRSSPVIHALLGFLPLTFAQLDPSPPPSSYVAPKHSGGDGSISYTCASSTNPSYQLVSSPHPYEFPRAGAPAEALFPMPKCHGVDIFEATIDDIQEHYSAGRLTTTQLVLCYIGRVNQLNEWINAVVELNPDALSIASRLDAERAQSGCRSPLHGIPFFVKENIATKDRMETTAGSWMLLGSVVPRDAHVVKRLRKQGALLLGKTAMSEWADMRSNAYSEGYSARAGQARSPYNFTVNPGGSSTGSATSVAANMAMFALGTETDGSVINPAMRNSLVGIKPTVGLTSRAGVVPESSHQDSVGTFGRSVRDAAYALDGIFGPDARDNYTAAQTGRTPSGGYAASVSTRSALHGAVFGLPWDSFWRYADAENVAALHDLISVLEANGATVLNGTELPNRELLVSPAGWDWDFGAKRGRRNESEYTVVKVDFHNDIAAYLGELSNCPIKSLQDIVDYNIANTGSEGGVAGTHPAFESGQDGFLASLETGGVMDETYHQALHFCQTQTRELGLDAALDTTIDGKKPMLLLAPPDVGQTYQVAAQAGYPIVTIPVGTHAGTGMAFGLSFMGSAWSEAALIRYASAAEDALKAAGGAWGRKLPRWGEYWKRPIPVSWDI